MFKTGLFKKKWNSHFPHPLILKFHPSSEWKIKEFIKNLRKESHKALHLGCGSVMLENVMNCDFYNPSADLKVNAIHLEQFEDASVDYIEHNHMIEHLSFEDAKLGVQEWARVLKNGGYLVITCPNLDFVAKLWLKYKDSENKEMREYVLKMIYGEQDHLGLFHVYGYNEKTLSELLCCNGFEIDFTYTPYPRSRKTPSMLIIAHKE